MAYFVGTSTCSTKRFFLVFPVRGGSGTERGRGRKQEKKLVGQRGAALKTCDKKVFRLKILSNVK